MLEISRCSVSYLGEKVVREKEYLSAMVGLARKTDGLYYSECRRGYIRAFVELELTMTYASVYCKTIVSQCLEGHMKLRQTRRGSSFAAKKTSVRAPIQRFHSASHISARLCQSPACHIFVIFLCLSCQPLGECRNWQEMRTSLAETVIHSTLRTEYIKGR